MEKILQFKFSIPVYFYFPALLLFEFAPGALQYSGWQLLNLALLESVLRAGQEKPPLFNSIVIYALRTLWVAKVLWALKAL